MSGLGYPKHHRRAILSDEIITYEIMQHGKNLFIALQKKLSRSNGSRIQDAKDR